MATQNESSDALLEIDLNMRHIREEALREVRTEFKEQAYITTGLDRRVESRTFLRLKQTLAAYGIQACEELRHRQADAVHVDGDFR